MTVHPVISGLNIITQKDVPAPVEDSVEASPAVVAEAPKKKLIVKRKTAVAPA
jgi:hypothetical protein